MTPTTIGTSIPCTTMTKFSEVQVKHLTKMARKWAREGNRVMTERYNKLIIEEFSRDEDSSIADRVSNAEKAIEPILKILEKQEGEREEKYEVLFILDKGKPSEQFIELNVKAVSRERAVTKAVMTMQQWHRDKYDIDVRKL